MPYPTIDSLPQEVRKLPKKGRRMWRAAFNHAFTEHNDEGRSAATAWAAVNNAGFGKKSTEDEKLSKELNVPLTEVEMGMKEELEHKDITQGDPVETAKIVAAHLKEDKEYYTKLKQAMEVKAMDIKVGAVKFVDEEKGIIEMLGMPYGGPFNGKDLAREHFEKDTDFCDSLFNSRPLLYHHGLDKTLGPIKAGEVIGYRDADVGRWVQAQLDKGMRYYEGIKDLIKRGALGASTAAIEHLKTADPDGKITRWPWFEISLTPSPCNPYAVVKSFKAIEDLTAAGLPIPEVLKEQEAKKMAEVKPDVKSEEKCSETIKPVKGLKGLKALKCVKCGMKIELPTEVVQALEALSDSVDEILMEAGGEQSTEQPAAEQKPSQPAADTPSAPSQPPVDNRGMAPETRAEPKEQGIKAKVEDSLQQISEKIRGAWNSSSIPTPVAERNSWIRDIFSDFVIVEELGKLFKVAYSVQDGDVKFDQNSKVEVKPTYTEATKAEPEAGETVAHEKQELPKQEAAEKPEEAVKAEAKKEVKTEVTPDAIKAMVGDAVKAVEAEHAKEVAALKGQIEALKAQPAPGGPVLRAATVVNNPKMGNANPATAMKAAYDEMLKDPTLDSSTRTFIARKAAVLEMTDIFEAGPQPLKK